MEEDSSVDQLSAQAPLSRNPLSAFVLVCLLCIALYLMGLGSWGLFDPDEGRYAEIPREMVQTGDWVTPRLDYVKYFEKPPLVYWLVAGTMTLFGENEYAARLGCAIPAVCGILFVFWFTRRLAGVRPAFLASVILGTSLIYLGVGHVVTTDMLLSVLMAAAGLVWWLGSEERRWGQYLAAGVLLAGATLAKGPVAVVLMGGAMLIYMAWTKRWAGLLCRQMIAALAVFAALALPWFILVMQRNSDFAHFFFWVQHVERFSNPTGEHSKPPWWFLLILIGGLIPYTAYLPAAVRHAWSGDAEAEPGRSGRLKLWLLIWSAVIFVFFSASSCKLMPYILPIFPTLAILLGVYFADVEAGQAGFPRFATALTGVAVIVLGAIGSLFAKRAQDIPYDLLRPHANAMTAVLCLTGVILLAAAARRIQPFRALAVGALAFEIAVLGTIPVATPYKSLRDMCLDVRAKLQPDDLVAEYQCLNQSVCFYLQRRVILLSGDHPFGSECLFGYQSEPEATKFWGRESDAAVEELLRGPQRVWMLVPQKNWLEFQNRFAGLYKYANSNADRIFVVNR
jgi:4-amino-4-deoxy-L-arabinose transferase-like glycosyltransferase